MLRCCICDAVDQIPDTDTIDIPISLTSGVVFDEAIQGYVCVECRENVFEALSDFADDEPSEE